jgi:type II pantothenate kinase
MSPFVRLPDPRNYVACAWDFKVDHEARRAWVAFLCRHIQTILNLGVDVQTRLGMDRAQARHKADACRDQFIAFCQPLADDPTLLTPLNILTLAQARDRILRQHGFADPFADLKQRENAAALPLLAPVCAEIDAADPPRQVRLLLENLFAGNIFDMGAGPTAEKFLLKSPDFFATRRELTPRPWLIDDFDALATALLQSHPHQRAVFFVDNAGLDFVLGAVPLTRWLARRGTSVVLVANELPSLNDMTIADVRALWPPIAAAEPSLAGLPIEFVTSGTGEPLIDLARVSPELNAAAADADLLILEGMGRAIESNLDAQFDCDVINLAMIKDQTVARHHHGKLFDLICRFRPRK